ncbi:MAG: formate dehydrogenase accessory sulfurtransferase FdhD [Sphingobium sp.]|nr:MAG: formate dehydrogenase accessory sulfurtransferase FdhD [Sphingobium sp.]
MAGQVDGARGEQVHGFTRIAADGKREWIVRPVAVEMPVALEFNGIGYAVLMASPSDVADLVAGFALSERLISGRDDFLGFDTHQTPDGLLVRVQLAADCSDLVLERVRHRVAESSCGLCGIENLEQALRPLPRVEAVSGASDTAIFHALERLDTMQPRHLNTGGMHAAALCTANGEPILVREDIGRHNAFDKLIGAMLTGGIGWDGGFALLSSRCSYELVEKAVLAGCPLLVTLSAPTTLALCRAGEAGLRVVVLARRDAMLAAGEEDAA